MSGRWNRIINVAILVTLAILLLNPSGVVARWFTTAYSGWQEQRRVERTWDELVSVPSLLGSRPRNDQGVIVEFVDYDCPVCQTVAPAVSEATRTRGVSVVVRHVPSERSGLAATEAALAAICTERYDLFPEAHDALISNRRWLSDRDWTGLGISLGIGDSQSFGNCMGEEATRNRLARDKALADYLRIPGTPTFVSASELHPGAPGLVSALAAISRVAVAEDRVPFRSLGQSAFDSSEHPDLAELPSVVAGFFLPDTGLALVHRSTIHLVDLSSGRARVVGREGEGPKEFGYIARANRTPRGILVWDVLRRRATFIAPGGEFLRSQSYGQVSFQGYYNAHPVAVDLDGRIVFRDGINKDFGDYEGRTWNPATYVAVQEDGELRIVAEAKGEEMYYGPKRSNNVAFGHRTFEAATEDYLIIAETDRGVIALVDWTGREVVEIPMPAGVRLSAAQMRAGRQSLVSGWERFAEHLTRAGAPGNWDEFDPSLGVKEWPMNEVAPPIDTVLTDFDARLWVRDYRLPGEDSVTWRVWDTDQAQLLFTARMDGDDTLLDARGDLVLLRRLDAFDVPRAVVIQLAPVPD